MRVIPFTDAPFWSEDVPIDNDVYRFQLTWNTRFEYWALSIYSTREDALVEGIKVCLNADIIRSYKYRDIPKGQIIPIRVNGIGNKRISKGELENGDVILFYFEVDNG